MLRRVFASPVSLSYFVADVLWLEFVCVANLAYWNVFLSCFV